MVKTFVVPYLYDNDISANIAGPNPPYLYLLLYFY